MIQEVQSEKEAEDEFKTVTEIGHTFHAFCYLNFNTIKCDIPLKSPK